MEPGRRLAAGGDLRLRCVVELNTEVAHRALDFLVPQQKLDCPQVAGPAVDESRRGSAQ
jgi:hypothetical protein